MPRGLARVRHNRRGAGADRLPRHRVSRTDDEPRRSDGDRARFPGRRRADSSTRSRRRREGCRRELRGQGVRGPAGGQGTRRPERARWPAGRGPGSGGPRMRGCVARGRNHRRDRGLGELVGRAVRRRGTQVRRTAGGGWPHSDARARRRTRSEAQAAGRWSSRGRCHRTPARKNRSARRHRSSLEASGARGWCRHSRGPRCRAAQRPEAGHQIDAGPAVQMRISRSGP